MANHPSAQKRARQSLKRADRHSKTRSRVNTAEKGLMAVLTDPKKAQEALSVAFSTIQKAKKSLHKNAIRRKMARLAKVVASKAKAAS